MQTPRRRKSYNNSTLSVRLPDQVLEQFTKLSETHFKTPSEMTRQLIVDYIKNAGVIAIQQVQVVPPNNPNIPRKPSEQVFHDDWD